MATITTDTFQKTGIYMVINMLNGKRYIGQSVDIERRWKVHKRFNVKGKSAINSAMQRDGIENFSFEILEECSRETLNERECFWINKLKSLAPLGYNLNSGGKSPLFVSDETRKKQRFSQLGKKHSAATVEKRRKSITGLKRTAKSREKMSLSQQGRKFTEEHKRNLSESHKGHPAHNKGESLSNETKEKISKSKKGKPAVWRNVPVVRNDGIVFSSLKEAASQINATYRGVWCVLNGTRKTIYGWSFVYLDKVGV